MTMTVYSLTAAADQSGDSVTVSRLGAGRAQLCVQLACNGNSLFHDDISETSYDFEGNDQANKCFNFRRCIQMDFKPFKA